MATGSDKDDYPSKPLDMQACEKTSRARRIVEDSTQVRRDECNAAMEEFFTGAQGGGQSAGIPASGEVEGNAVSTLGNPGIKHWQAGFIGRAGLDDGGDVFFAAVAMTRMPMVVTDPNQPDNPIVFANGAFFDLTGYDEDHVLGHNCRFLQGPDGEPFWNALFIGPVFDPHGKLLYFFASQRDITERRGMQEANLQAQKMEAIGQLSAGMAHDFNNLLQVINGNLELALLVNGANPKAAGPIRRAQRATMQAGKLTQQLLSFARKQRLDQKQVNLNSLVVDFSDMLVRTLGDKVELRLDLKPGLPPCTLDTTYLEMALLNVVINARDAMRPALPVLVTTGYMDELPARGQSLDVLAKPYHHQTLLERVQAALQVRRAA